MYRHDQVTTNHDHNNEFKDENEALRNEINKIKVKFYEGNAKLKMLVKKK